jgi:hypothetical protein
VVLVQQLSIHPFSWTYLMGILHGVSTYPPTNMSVYNLHSMWEMSSCCKWCQHLVI